MLGLWNPFRARDLRAPAHGPSENHVGARPAWGRGAERRMGPSGRRSAG
jgi:hypothetical protein